MSDPRPAPSSSPVPDGAPPLADSPEASPGPRRNLIEERVAVVALAILVVITMLNVLTRYFVQESFAWTEEISIFLMVVLTLAGAASAAAGDRHIRIEYFYETGTPERRRRLVVFSAWVSGLFFFGLATAFGLVVFDEVRYGETSMGLGVPRWWYSIWVPLLCVLIGWRALRFARRIPPVGADARSTPPPSR